MRFKIIVEVADELWDGRKVNPLDVRVALEHEIDWLPDFRIINITEANDDNNNK